MTLKERITQDLSNALKAKIKTGDLKIVVGEIQRLPDKDPSDEVVIKVLTKLSKGEKENLKRIGDTTSEFLQIIELYLPEREEQSSDEEIIKWIQANIDFEDFRNKMESIKIIKEHFGPKINGQTVKNILMEKF